MFTPGCGMWLKGCSTVGETTHLLSSAGTAGPRSAAGVWSTSVTGTGVSSVTLDKAATSTTGTGVSLDGKTKAATFDSVRIKVAIASVTGTGESFVEVTVSASKSANAAAAFARDRAPLLLFFLSFRFFFGLMYGGTPVWSLFVMLSSASELLLWASQLASFLVSKAAVGTVCL